MDDNWCRVGGGGTGFDGILFLLLIVGTWRVVFDFCIREGLSFIKFYYSRIAGVWG